jgi:hypothetical protein
LLTIGKDRSGFNETLGLGNAMKLSNIDHFPGMECCIMSR